MCIACVCQHPVVDDGYEINRTTEVMGKFLLLFVAVFAIRDILKLISQVPVNVLIINIIIIIIQCICRAPITC